MNIRQTIQLTETAPVFPHGVFSHPISPIPCHDTIRCHAGSRHCSQYHFRISTFVCSDLNPETLKHHIHRMTSSMGSKLMIRSNTDMTHTTRSPPIFPLTNNIQTYNTPSRVTFRTSTLTRAPRMYYPLGRNVPSQPNPNLVDYAASHVSK